MSTLKYEEMSSLLRKSCFEEDVIDIFFKNRIDKEIFKELTKDDFQQLGVVALGDIKRLQLMKENVMDAEVSVTSLLCPLTLIETLRNLLPNDP